MEGRYLLGGGYSPRESIRQGGRYPLRVSVG